MHSYGTFVVFKQDGLPRVDSGQSGFFLGEIALEGRAVSACSNESATIKCCLELRRSHWSLRYFYPRSQQGIVYFRWVGFVAPFDSEPYFIIPVGVDIKVDAWKALQLVLIERKHGVLGNRRGRGGPKPGRLLGEFDERVKSFVLDVHVRTIPRWSDVSKFSATRGCLECQSQCPP